MARPRSLLLAPLPPSEAVHQQVASESARNDRALHPAKFCDLPSVLALSFSEYSWEGIRLIPE